MARASRETELHQVAGATRGAGRGIAVQLGAAGATVYVTGRTTRSSSSGMNRPETIEETAALVARIEREQGALHILVNDILGLTKMEWNKTVWESDLDYGLHLLRLGIDTHAITSHFALPMMITRPGALVIEVNDGTTDYNAANSMAASQTRGGISSSAGRGKARGCYGLPLIGSESSFTKDGARLRHQRPRTAFT